jgi:ketohexokinase
MVIDDSIFYFHTDWLNRSLLCCTWGSGGATLVQKSSDADQWVSVEAWQSPQHPVIDTIGAGDTFIAGMLYMLTCAPDLNLLQQLSFANELAGRKVTQEGFNNLGLTIHG